MSEMQWWSEKEIKSALNQSVWLSGPPVQIFINSELSISCSLGQELIKRLGAMPRQATCIFVARGGRDAPRVHQPLQLIDQAVHKSADY